MGGRVISPWYDRSEKGEITITSASDSAVNLPHPSLLTLFSALAFSATSSAKLRVFLQLPLPSTSLKADPGVDAGGEGGWDG